MLRGNHNIGSPSGEDQSECLVVLKAQAANADGEGGGGQAALDTASFFRWSMKTCRLTSSVRMGAPDSCRKRRDDSTSDGSTGTRSEVKGETLTCPQVYMLLWVCDGLTLDSRKRACEQLQVRSVHQFHIKQSVLMLTVLPSALTR